MHEGGGGKGAEERGVNQAHDRAGIVEFEHSDPEQDQAQTEAQGRGGGALSDGEQRSRQAIGGVHEGAHGNSFSGYRMGRTSWGVSLDGDGGPLPSRSRGLT